jgi:hypothetical protein
MLPSEAAMPPWAATVWLRVGKDLGDAGGLQPLFGRAHGGAQARSAGADDHDIIAVVDAIVGGARLVSICSHLERAPPEGDLQDAEGREQPAAINEEGEQRDPQHPPLSVWV